MGTHDLDSLMSTRSQKASVLEAALSGSREAFEELSEPHRRELQVHCYRMMGSTLDAEDLVQETLIRAWKKLHTFEARAPFRAWLYRIATNACLDELSKRTGRSLPFEIYPASNPKQPLEPAVMDPIWIEPFPDAWLEAERTNPAARYDQRESVTLAFLVALQTLPPRQRAILILRDVLGLPANDVADLLEITASAVSSALYRARNRLVDIYPAHTYASPATDPVVQLLLERYVEAWEAADIDGLVSLLREDATFPMPPSPSWYHGRDAIREFVSRYILDGESKGRWRLLPTRANGQPAFAWYRRGPGGTTYSAFAIQVVTLDGDLVADATTFVYPQLFATFGLPAQIEGKGSVK